MVNEGYFKKLEAKQAVLIKFGYLTKEELPKLIELAREIAKYTDDEKKVTRLINALRRGEVSSIEELMEADIDELAKIRNIGLDTVNILRQIKGLPTITYSDVHPFSKKNTKDKIIEELHKLGYEYKPKRWDDGTIYTHNFICPDCTDDVCYWEVAIEDHADDNEDWLIFVRYHDPYQRDWDV